MNKTNMLTTKQELLNTPFPLETKTYKPIRHEELINLTIEGLEKQNFSLINETYIAANNGLIATAYYDINYGDDPEMGLRIAWQNSYNKQVSLKFAIGVNVFVCSNGGFYGDMGAFKKKHKGNIQTFTPHTINEYFKQAAEVYEIMCKDKKRLKEIELNKKVMAQLVGEMYINEALLKETQIAIIKKEIESPSFDYGTGIGSGWELYNHATHSFKSLHPRDYIEKHTQLHDFFSKKFELVHDNAQSILELNQ